MDWQPIETAPRDGTKVLGFGSEGVEIMHYERIQSHYYTEAQGQPTHWMPLPDGPLDPGNAHAGQVAAGAACDVRSESEWP